MHRQGLLGSRRVYVRCIVGLALLAPAAVLSSLGGCNYLAVLGNYPTDGGPREADVPCGAKTCANGATCLDGTAGTCSTDIVEVSAGAESTCAVMANGTVWCWGGNQYGAVGVPAEGDSVCTANNTPVACRHSPVQVEGLSDVLHVSTGYGIACAVKRDNSVWCWGNNEYGVLGHARGTQGDGQCHERLFEDGGDGGVSSFCNPVPKQVPNLAASEVAVGSQHACAVDVDGVVVCWGRNFVGALGNREVIDPDWTSLPHRVTGLPLAKHVSIGVSSVHTCAIAGERDAVWCWGHDSYGQLGHPIELNKDCVDPTNKQRDGGSCSLTAMPVRWTKVQDDASVSVPFENVTAVRAAFLYTCALRNGDVWCWGSSEFGTFGMEVNTDHSVRPNPQQLVGIPRIREIDTRFAHTCAIDQESKVLCWGANILGSLGAGNITGEVCQSGKCWRNPQSTRITGATGIATGFATGFAIHDGHRAVSAWGSNDTARLGHEPKAGGDLTLCGDTRESVCNPTPGTIPGFPP